MCFSTLTPSAWRRLSIIPALSAEPLSAYSIFGAPWKGNRLSVFFCQASSIP